MDQNQQKNFLDPNTLVAIVVVAICWMGWQWYMQNKYPETFNPAPVEQSVQTTEPAKPSDSTLNEISQQKGLRADSVLEKNDEIAAPVEIKEQLTHFEDELWSFSISSFGMGIKQVHLKKYKNREHEVMVLAEANHRYAFESRIMGDENQLNFSIKKIDATTFEGVAQAGDLKIIKTIQVNSQLYSIDTVVEANSSGKEIKGISTYIAEVIHDKQPTNFLLPSFEHQEIYSLHQNGEDRVIVDEEDLDVKHASTSVASIGSQYFALAMLDKSEILPEFEAKVAQKQGEIVGVMNYMPADSRSKIKIEYTAFIGPKSLHLLNEINPNMAGVINFGMFSFIGVYILKIMQWFYALIGNWGVAVILLTILVRIILLPFNIMSFKSMKAMQKLQPLIKDLKERLKDEPQKMNQEMMRLMRENKANPMGGCLPMLLQLPVFFALYQVLGQSVELYQSPFIFWIHDLSLKDPYFVLPALMGVTMFFQQKITPTTMDPTQAKIMMFMPIIFTFMMVTLPSGLTLYIFINSLFGVIQQYYFMKEKPQAA